MSEHTKEPWVFSPDRHLHDSFIHAANAKEDCGYIDPDDGGIFGSSEWSWFKPEDARRAVDCVNACAGINPEAVPEMLRLAQMVSSLNENHLEIGAGRMLELVTVARNAITKAEANQ